MFILIFQSNVSLPSQIVAPCSRFPINTPCYPSNPGDQVLASDPNNRFLTIRPSFHHSQIIGPCYGSLLLPQTTVSKRPRLAIALCSYHRYLAPATTTVYFPPAPWYRLPACWYSNRSSARPCIVCLIGNLASPPFRVLHTIHSILIPPYHSHSTHQHPHLYQYTLFWHCHPSLYAYTPINSFSAFSFFFLLFPELSYSSFLCLDCCIPYQIRFYLSPNTLGSFKDLEVIDKPFRSLVSYWPARKENKGRWRTNFSTTFLVSLSRRNRNDAHNIN